MMIFFFFYGFLTSYLVTTSTYCLLFIVCGDGRMLEMKAPPVIILIKYYNTITTS